MLPTYKEVFIQEALKLFPDKKEEIEDVWNFDPKDKEYENIANAYANAMLEHTRIYVTAALDAAAIRADKNFVGTHKQYIEAVKNSFPLNLIK